MKFPYLHLLVGLLFTWILAACNPLPEAGQLRFANIEQKADSGYMGQEQYSALEPGLVVIASREAADQYGVLFSESARKSLRQLNFDRQVALAVFQGWKFTPGYGVEILSVERDGSQVKVTANFDHPEKKQSANDRVTSPYHLVQIWKLGLWSDDMQYELLVDGEVAAVFPPPPQ